MITGNYKRESLTLYMFWEAGLEICNVLMSHLISSNRHSKLFAITVDNDRSNDYAIKFAKISLGKFLVCDRMFFT